MIKLGNKVKDIVSGFTGIATAKVVYLNGCVQFCVNPPMPKNGKGEYIKGRYFDEEQLKKVTGGIKIKKKAKVVDPGGPQSNTPGSSYNG